MPKSLPGARVTGLEAVGRDLSKASVSGRGNAT
jgi:hypothetical protein